MFSTVAAALAAAGLLSTPALAADPPVPCSPDVVLADASGDSFFDPTLGFSSFNPTLRSLGHEAAPESDPIGLFFTWGKVAGKTVLWANVQLNKASLTPPPATDAAGGSQLYVVYRWKGDAYYLRAANTDGSRMVFEYGTVTVSSTSSQYDGATGTTTGTVFPGDKGFVQITVPSSVGGKLNQMIQGAAVTADYRQTPQGAPGLVTSVDALPDSFDGFAPNGTDVLVGTCGLPEEPEE